MEENMSCETTEKNSPHPVDADDEYGYPPMPFWMVFTIEEVAELTELPCDQIENRVYRDDIEAKYGPDRQGWQWYIPRDEVIRLRGGIE
jgi:hypothetical protein